MKKSLFVIAFGVAVGYVLGARAGRERYEEIVGRVNGVWQDPRVSRARREAAQYAREQAPVIAERAQAVAKAAPGAIADAGKVTAAVAKDVAKDVADRATTIAKDTAERATTVAKDARERTVSAATLAATRVGEARDDALEDFDDDK
jgi:sRNA-binding protein